ncbi:Gfo/Idh/MocA family protein [Verrucomicrobiota bacterium]
MTTKLSRRRFIYGTVAGGAVLSGTFPLRWAYASPNEKLNVACVGCGGKGKGNVSGVSKENIVALCDVDSNKASGIFEKHPDVPKFKDYRKMLDKMDKEIDAVVISTPDHVHFPIGMAAIGLGKHVYIEKPLTYSIKQAREIKKAARDKKVATQMGNQGHSAEATYMIKEWIQAGLIGEIKEVQCWTNRPIWPQGMTKFPDPQPVPDHLDWKLWQAGITDYKYNAAYLPFKWRGWYSFGCGALGDMGCHILDASFYALDLGDAKTLTVQAETSGESKVAFPESSTITMEFPARGNFPPVKLTWYDGEENKPPHPKHLEKERKLPNPVGGSAIVGEDSTIMAQSHCKSARIIPEVKMQELAPELPPKTLPRPKGGHCGSWITACKGGKPAASNFDYAAPLTELCLIGAIAQRFPGQKLEWDKEKGFLNNKEANLLVDDPLPKII